MTNFSKTDLVRAVAEATSLRKSDVEEALAAAFLTIREEAEAGKTVAIHGFGRFSMKERPARQGVNLRTREPMEFPASRKLSFKPTKPSKSSN